MTEEETMEKVKRVEAAHSGGKKEIEAEEPGVEGADDNIPVILPHRLYSQHKRFALDPCMSIAYMYSDAGKSVRSAWSEAGLQGLNTILLEIFKYRDGHDIILRSRHQAKRGFAIRI